MQTRRRAHRHDIAVGVTQHLVIGSEALHSFLISGGTRTLRYDVAHRGECEAFDFAQGLEVILADATATNQSELEICSCVCPRRCHCDLTRRMPSPARSYSVPQT